MLSQGTAPTDPSASSFLPLLRIASVEVTPDSIWAVDLRLQLLTDRHNDALIDLRDMRFKGLDNDFGASCPAHSVQLPPSLLWIERRVFLRSNLVALDLRGTQVIHIGDEFLNGTPLRQLHFPATLKSIGFKALQYTLLEHVDLSHTEVQRVRSGFLNGSTSLKSVMFPVTLTVDPWATLSTLSAPAREEEGDPHLHRPAPVARYPIDADSRRIATLQFDQSLVLSLFSCQVVRDVENQAT
jgi:hypothetical protein